MATYADIDHIVVVMLENRSFDNLLGFLYDAGNQPPRNQAFDGLTGDEFNLDSSRNHVQVSKIDPADPNAYWYPLVNPQEGFTATNLQLFGTATPADGDMATCSGFVASYEQALHQAGTGHHPPALDGATEGSIMKMYPPEMVPVLSGLAKGFAVCDHWYSSVPTETFPNRAFALSGTSLGRLDDSNAYFATPSIFGSLSNAKPNPVSWKIYGYVLKALTIGDYPDTVNADPSHFGLFTDFQSDAANGQLPGFSFLEPAWSKSGTTIENDQHPVANVALGEKFIYDVYQAVRTSPSWSRTLLIVTYDEHGGNYDHVPPPTNAAQSTPASNGFDFTRFGVRVPSVLVSPLIEAGTIFRSTDATPLDHTSILATIEKKYGLAALTARDAAAPDLEAVLSLDPANPNTVDPLATVTVPAYQAPVGADVSITEQAHQVLLHHAAVAANLPVVGEDNAAAASTAAAFLSNPSPNGEDVAQFIEDRLTKWTTQTSLVHTALRPGNRGRR